MLPNRTLRNGDVLTFYTRKMTIGGGQTDYPDRLETRMSTNGASANVGAGGTAVGDFTSLLLSINPALVANVYPQVWTQYTITISGLPAPTSGRLAFRYFVTSAGPTGTNSDYIGIDEVNYTPYVCPAITLTAGGALTGGTEGSAYSVTLSQTGALGAPNFAVTAGALPPGVTLSAGGTISGTPTASGTFNFTATANDASGCSGSQSYSITVVLIDTDGDSIGDYADNCPAVANANQLDTDGDNIGDLCDSTPNGDTDGDGVDNAADNCPLDANSSQTDSDSDGAGDACDSDDDADGVDDGADNCPLLDNPGQQDTDADGIGDSCDVDPTDPDPGVLLRQTRTDRPRLR